MEDGAPGHGCGQPSEQVPLLLQLRVKEYLEKNQKEGTVVFFGRPGEKADPERALWREMACSISWTLQ